MTLFFYGLGRDSRSILPYFMMCRSLLQMLQRSERNLMCVLATDTFLQGK